MIDVGHWTTVFHLRKKAGEEENKVYHAIFNETYTEEWC